MIDSFGKTGYYRSSRTAQQAEQDFTMKGEVYWNAYGGIDSYCLREDDDMVLVGDIVR